MEAVVLAHHTVFSQPISNCNEIDGKSDSSMGGSFSTGVYGIVFDVNVNKDVYFYEIEGDLTLQHGNGIPAKVYTKNESYTNGDNNLNNWEKVFDATSSIPDFYKTLNTLMLGLQGPSTFHTQLEKHFISG